MNELEAYAVLQNAWVKKNKIKIGDTVRIISKYIGIEFRGAYHDDFSFNSCTKKEDMQGKEYPIWRICENYIEFNTDQTTPHFPFYALEVIKKKEDMITVAGKDYSESTIKAALQEYVK
jgi:hypothetical protein